MLNPMEVYKKPTFVYFLYRKLLYVQQQIAVSNYFVM